jgi:hypothetical protein
VTISGPILSFLSFISRVLINPKAFIIKIEIIGNSTEMLTIDMTTNPSALSPENPKR